MWGGRTLTFSLDGVVLEDPFPAMPPELRRSRSKIFARSLGIGNADFSVLDRLLRQELAEGAMVSSHRLLELGHKASFRLMTETDELKQWRETLLARLHEAFPEVIVSDALPDKEDDSDSWLDVRTLLYMWPRQLLEDSKWACVEAPLYNMKPLPLDETWVDIQLIDPSDPADNEIIENFHSNIERRYEERRWRAEPADFLIDRLGDSTALIGAPGTGKTTFLKWLARRLLRQTDGRFLLPLFVPLRQYVLESEHVGRGSGMLAYALRLAGLTDIQQITRWSSALAHLSGVRRENVLLLLDGWDEVPEGKREKLLNEIEDIGHAYAILITSRPSAFPLRLPVGHFHEITELSPESVDKLIQRWFSTVNQTEQGNELVAHLDSHPDLRRMARNPFLLTLLCGITYGDHGKSTLPGNRATLYKTALELIRKQHSQRYPDSPFDSLRVRQTERLAWWLMNDAPEAPRYVFNAQEVVDCCNDTSLFTKVLQPSRLLNQWDNHSENLHFIHTTFQEYLAAQAMEHQLTQPQLQQFIEDHFQDIPWQEVFRFWAADSHLSNTAFWKTMSRFARSPDRFGLIYIRLARFVAESGEQDGGLACLGFDLREVLWVSLLNGIEMYSFAEAYADIDPDGYLKRMSQYVAQHDGELATRMMRTLSRVRSPAASKLLVKHILEGDKSAASVAVFAAREVIDSEGRALLRNTAQDSHFPEDIRERAIRALGYARDFSSVPLLMQVARTEPALRRESLRSLSRIGGETAASELGLWLNDVSEHSLEEELIDALGMFREPMARDQLMLALARCHPASSLVPNILHALSENPIPRDAELIIEYLHREAPDIRVAAAWTLAEAFEPGVREALANTAKSDPESLVRIAALGALRKHACMFDGHWLSERVEDKNVSILERANALEALLLLASRYRHKKDGSWLHGKAAAVTVEMLSSPNGELTFTAASRAYLLGDCIGENLILICKAPQFPADVKEAACDSLGKLKTRSAIEVLRDLLHQAPDAGDDEQAPEIFSERRLARAAAQALARIDPTILLHENGQAAREALARLSIESGALVYAEYIHSPNQFGNNKKTGLNPINTLGQSSIATVHPACDYLSPSRAELTATGELGSNELFGLEKLYLTSSIPHETGVRLLPAVIPASTQYSAQLPRPQLSCIYAEQDDDSYKEFALHMASIKHVVQVLDFRDVLPGKETQQSREAILQKSSLLVFLLSPNFFADDECVRLFDEIKNYRFRGNIPALVIRVKPVYLDYPNIPLVKLLPPDGSAISSGQNTAEKWAEIVSQLLDLIRLK